MGDRSLTAIWDTCDWRCVDVFSSECSVGFASFDVVCDEFEDGMWDVC